MRLLDSLFPPDPPAASICTVGAFDGVHLGHQQLIHAVVNQAHARRAQSVVVSFYPHPRVFLGRAPAIYLTTPDEKAEQMAALGVDGLVIYPFDEHTQRLTAAEFIRHMLDGLHMTSLWIGPDFALGRQRQGNAAYLTELGRQHGFEVNVLPPVNVGPERISSTRIRQSLARGDIRDVNLCLGRPFRVIGTWVDDHHVLAPADHALPPPGTYPVWICRSLNQADLLPARQPGNLCPSDSLIHLADAVAACERVEIDFVG
ncbi:MAG: FAD synthetase family protein [Anaerolineae bacterium]|nr:FAD synthetase family protein [Thermoflexales bacterium]MDW8407991.1 FAD synthetase family protein [Anaerolineae bacterium]